LTPPSSGSAGNPITFGAYGNGAAPILDGSEIVLPGSSWSSAGFNVWTASVTTEPNVVFFDGVKGTKVASHADCTGKGKWFWAANSLLVYSATDPDTAYRSPGIEVGALDSLLYVLSGRSYIACDGLHFRRGNGSVVDMVWILGTHITIRNCEIDNGANAGLTMASTSGDVLITGCHSRQRNRMVSVYRTLHLSDENIFSHNLVHDNGLVPTGSFCGAIYVWAVASSA
jgi:hypothetical protein